jgi:hypothetical protein
MFRWNECEHAKLSKTIRKSIPRSQPLRQYVLPRASHALSPQEILMSAQPGGQCPRSTADIDRAALAAGGENRIRLAVRRNHGARLNVQNTFVEQWQSGEQGEKEWIRVKSTKKYGIC